jgi:hypothetical protein
LEAQKKEEEKSQAAEGRNEQRTSKTMSREKQEVNNIGPENVNQVFCNRQDNSQAEEKKVQSKLLKSIRRFAKSVILTKDLGMGLARLDPHRIAPIVLGGVYCIATIIDGNIDARKSAFLICRDILNTLALWKFIEQYQIVPNIDEDVNEEYEQLQKELVIMYADVIVLLETLTAYFDSKWREYIQSSHVTLLSD